MTPLAVSGMMLLVPLCLPSIPAASPAHPQHLRGAGPC